MKGLSLFSQRCEIVAMRLIALMAVAALLGDTLQASTQPVEFISHEPGVTAPLPCRIRILDERKQPVLPANGPTWPV